MAHEYQAPIRNALEDFWGREVASENGSPWQKYLEMAIPGVASGARKSRMYRRNLKKNIFGHEWVFDLFVAFGMVNKEMVAAIAEACLHWTEFRSCASRKRSSAAGNDCKENLPEGIFARAVRKYLAATKGTWQHVRNWKTGNRS